MLDGLCDRRSRIQGQQVLLQGSRLSAADALKMRVDLEKLPPLADSSRSIDFDKRFMFLDFVACIVRDRAPKNSNDPKDPSDVMAQDLNGLAQFAHETSSTGIWCFARATPEFDRIVEACRKLDRKQRRNALAVINRQSRAAAMKPSELQASILNSRAAKAGNRFQALRGRVG